MTRILIIKPSSLGDIVHTFPSAAMLTAAIPGVELDWVSNDTLSQIVGLYPAISQIVPFPRRAVGRCSIPEISRFIHELRKREYDAVIDYQGLLRSGLIARFSHSPLRIGFAHARECAPFFYTHKIVVPQELRHAADKNRYLTAAALDILKIPYQKDELFSVEAQLELPLQWQQGASELIAQQGWEQQSPLLAVGCSSRWKSKSWNEEFFADVLRHVIELAPGMRIWLLGGAEESERAQRVCELCGHSSVIANFAGKTTLGTLAAMLARSKCMLTNDSGPMHIAAALKIPCVALFGATEAEKTGPYGPPGRHTVIHSLCPQSPCFKRICPRDSSCRTCPQGVDSLSVARHIISV